MTTESANQPARLTAIELENFKGVGERVRVDLNDSIIDQGNGYWIKIEAWRVNATAAPRMAFVTPCRP